MILKSALEDFTKLLKEYKNDIIKHGCFLVKNNSTSKRPYKDFKTRFCFDAYWAFKHNNLFNIYNYISDENLKDAYIATLLYKAFKQANISTLEVDYK